MLVCLGVKGVWSDKAGPLIIDRRWEGLSDFVALVDSSIIHWVLAVALS